MGALDGGSPMLPVDFKKIPRRRHIKGEGPQNYQFQNNIMFMHGPKTQVDP